MNKSKIIQKLKAVFLPIILEIAIILGGLVLDLTSKAIIQNTMYEDQSVTLIPKFLNFYYTKNTKAGFGWDFGLGKLLGEKGVIIFFIVLTLVAVGFFAYLLFKRPQKGLIYRISFSLVISGAIGNLVDRMFLGYVRDFIQFEYFGLTIFGSKSFAVFNIADSCVVVGAIMLIVYFIFFDKSLKSDASEVKAEISGDADQIETIQSVEQNENNDQNENSEDSQSEEKATSDQNSDG